MSDDTRATAGKQRFDALVGRHSDAVIAYSILRISFGVNFMLHGVSRLLADHANFVGCVNHYFEHTPFDASDGSCSIRGCPASGGGNSRAFARSRLGNAFIDLGSGQFLTSEIDSITMSAPRPGMGLRSPRPSLNCAAERSASPVR